MSEVTVYVPKLGTIAAQMIDAGSGVVGQPGKQVSAVEVIEVYYEGNRFGYSNVHTFADRVKVAADRMGQSYPTIARAVYPVDMLVEVGQFDGRQVLLVDGDDRVALALIAAWIGWLGGDRLEDELVCTS
jgi:hypothetical protein